MKPHQSRYFLHITDPDFFPKMEHLIGLYRRPPPNLIFFDECPGIQILKRLTPDLQTDAMRKRLEEFEYIRHGTLDVFAFLHHADGKVHIECQSDHKTDTFLAVFRRHVNRFPNTEPLDYVMDNLAAHRGYPFCQLVAELSAVACPPARQLCSMDKVEDTPSDCAAAADWSDEEKLDYLTGLASRLVSLVWKATPMEDVNKVLNPEAAAQEASSTASEEEEEEEPDCVQRYSHTLIWLGLKDLANRDGIREGDGDYIISTWKMDMLGFWKNHHPKYVIFAHRSVHTVPSWCYYRNIIKIVLVFVD